MARTQTSVAFERIAGTLADGVAYGHRGGTALRSRPKYRYPLRPNTAEGNARLKRANALINTLTGEEADAWTLYGERHPRRDPMSGTLYAPAAKNLLVGFSSKLLQIDPDADLPRLPPLGTFGADLVDVRVEATSGIAFVRTPENESMALPLGTGRGGVGHGYGRPAEGGSTPTLPSPKGEAMPATTHRDPVSAEVGQSGPTGLLFTAPRASRPGTLTELMVQPLKNVRCKPGRFYKSRGFATFPEGDLAVFLPMPPGVYAVAIQTVEASSGRTAGLTALAKVTVD